MQSCLNARGEGVLISSDVKGAFDRVWWGRLKAKGKRGRALRLMKSYLSDRFFKVVSRSPSSTRKQIFSGVPQGAKWSPLLWNFDISEMPEVVSDDADSICYADDRQRSLVRSHDDEQSLFDWHHQR